ncbi:MAG: AMP-binding protein [Clostridia bacterium]|nr:AMP-binding protein [Clostridia bacterium]
MARGEWALEPETLPDLLQQRASAYPERPALVWEGSSTTYAQLAEWVDRVAAGLQRLGVGRGDRVAVWLVNRPEWVVLEFAAARIGAVVVALNTRFRTQELGYILGHSEAKVLVLGEPFRQVDFAAILGQLCPDLVHAAHRLPVASFPALRHVVYVGGDPRPGWIPFAELERASTGVPEAAGPGADDPVNLLYTSGTTSSPKGAIRTHGNLVRHAVHLPERWGLGPADVVFWGFPLCGTTGLMLMLATVAAGACGLPAPDLSPEVVWPLLSREGCTFLPAADLTFKSWLAWEGRAQWPLQTVRAGFMALFGSGEARRLLEELEAAFGGRFVQPYGLTEANAFVLCSGPDEPLEVRAQIGGRPVPPVEARVVDVETGAPVPDGTPGEILLRGPTILPGYYKNPEASRDALDADGWLHTGDLGVAEGGRVFFLSRLKDVLKVHGFNFSPREVEEVLQRHPAVDLVQVVGAQGPEGEMAVAFVRLKPAAACAEDDLIAFCRGRVAPYKVPRRIFFVDDFPMTEGPQGNKIQRHRLREMAAARLAAENTQGVDEAEGGRNR